MFVYLAKIRIDVKFFIFLLFLYDDSQYRMYVYEPISNTSFDFRSREN